jgi:Plant ATP synthase F0
MPQFDTSSFIVQLIWLFFSFLTFYFFFSLYILPLWGSLIKTRKKTTTHLKNPSQNLENSVLISVFNHKKNKIRYSTKNYF